MVARLYYLCLLGQDVIFRLRQTENSHFYVHISVCLRRTYVPL